MSKFYRKKDKYGSYELSFKDGIMRALVVGAIGESLATYFHQDVVALLANIGSQTWAYYGDMSLCDGTTKAAEEKILETHVFCIDKGCRVDAHRIVSPLVKDQIERIRRKIAVKGVLDSQIFDNENDALTFLHRQLSKYALHNPDLK